MRSRGSRPGAGTALADPALRPARRRSRSTSRWPSSATGRRRRSRPIAADGRGRWSGPARDLQLGEPVPRPGARQAAALRAAGRLTGGRSSCRRRSRRGWSRAGFYEPEERPFWPHVTVARVRPEARDRGGRGRSRAARAAAARPLQPAWRPSLALPFRTQVAGCGVHPAGARRAEVRERDGRQKTSFEGRLGQGGQGQGRGARERGDPASARSSARAR